MKLVFKPFACGILFWCLSAGTALALDRGGNGGDRGGGIPGYLQEFCYTVISGTFAEEVITYRKDGATYTVILAQSPGPKSTFRVLEAWVDGIEVGHSSLEIPEKECQL